MKYFLWAGTLAILALLGFTLSGFLATPHHESLSEQAAKSPPEPIATPAPLLVPSAEGRALAAEDSPAGEATPPPPTFDDPQKQAALEQLVRAKAEMQTLRPPQLSSSDPATIAAGINGYVNALGQRAQAYNQAKAALSEHLSKAESARLSQILAQP